MEYRERAGRLKSVAMLWLRQKTLDVLWGNAWTDAAWRSTKGYRVLCYHSVGFEQGLFDQGEMLSVSPEDFEKHLRYFKDHFEVISMEELTRREAGGDSTDKCLVITFDDGYQALFEHGIPLLEAYEMPCTIFLSTAFLDNRDVSWPLKINYLKNAGAADAYRKVLKDETGISDEIVDDNIVAYAVSNFSGSRTKHIISKAFNEAGIDENAVCKEAALYVSSDVVRSMNSELVAFGNHTHTHPVMGALTADEQRAEMEMSHKILREDLRLAGFLPFAFPFGKPRVDFSAESIRIVRDIGYDCICAASFNKFRIGRGMGCVNRIPMPVDVFDEKKIFGRLCRIR